LQGTIPSCWVKECLYILFPWANALSSSCPDRVCPDPISRPELPGSVILPTLLTNAWHSGLFLRSRDSWVSVVTLAPLFSSFSSRKLSFSSIMPRKNNNHILLSCYIRSTGFEMNNPCSRCLSLSKSCVASPSSGVCSECTRAKKNCSLSSRQPTSAGDWNRLLKAHDKIENERRSLLESKRFLREEQRRLHEEQAHLDDKEDRLQKQAELLRRRGGRMVQEGVETLEELEILEAQEQTSSRSPVTIPSASVETPIDFSGLGPEFWESLDFSGETSESLVVPSSGP
jgi:hypothetical protein